MIKKSGRPPKLNIVPLGQRLALIRKYKKLDQKYMQNLCNVSKGTYSNWENSKSYPSLEQIIKICKELDISSDVLLGLKPLVFP